MARRLLILVLVAAACARPGTRTAVHTPPADTATVLDLAGAIARIVPAELAAVYTPRAYAPVFLTTRGAVDRAASAIDSLAALDADGLVTPELPRARRLLSAGRADSLAQLDVLLTAAWLDAARALAGGRVVPAAIDSAWDLMPEGVDAADALARAIAADRVAASLAEVRPPHAGYAGLRAAWLRYRAIADQGGWPALPAGAPLGPDSRGPAVATLRVILAQLGDLDSNTVAGDSYDEPLAAAVRTFQRRHGLVPDGRVGDPTRAALSIPVTARLRQIEVNLERWRWLPRQLEPPYVMVNIPAYELAVVDSAGTVTRRRVILGRPDWRTPLLRGTITHVVIAPSWGVPPEIARRELAPLLRADTGYATRTRMLVYPLSGEPNAVDPATVDWSAPDSAFPYRLVQLPGPTNPLGRVKLVFRNRFGVYLHDTPAVELFGSAERALSHGCVRVEDALGLARWLLHERPDWAARLDTLAAAGTTQWIRLPRAVPVYLVYFTTWVDARGDLQFRDDLYGWDGLLSAALSSRLP